MISNLLEGTVEELDIPPQLRAAADYEYHCVGSWLAAHADPGGLGWRVYPQGSFRLGTVVRPEGSDEYDLDAVCLRSIAKEHTTQALLKAETGQALAAYLTARADEAGGPRECQERKRCWTLLYGYPFHLDVLPAVPNPETPPSGILLTDRSLHLWQHSDPVAYARWFRHQMRRELLAKRARLAEAEHVPPEQIPAETVKTTLQRVVQVLKAHRNGYFADDLDSRPTSILITTLAARVYSGEQDLDEAVLETAREMPSQIEYEADRWIVANPVEPRENFADKWNDRPELAVGFFEWLDRLQQDLQDARESEGLDRTVLRLSESFGEGPVQKAAARIGDLYRDSRDRGALAFAGTTGLLSSRGTSPVQRHDFYGE
ncbi:MAG TPA: nucleotidyltransferase [Solirubrobacteraceae bacterium]|nr:nucleotidyltransferase [Solirubrobacteraceae bacterium]